MCLFLKQFWQRNPTSQLLVERYRIKYELNNVNVMMLNPVSNLVLAISNSFFVFEPIQSCDLFWAKRFFRALENGVSGGISAPILSVCLRYPRNIVLGTQIRISGPLGPQGLSNGDWSSDFRSCDLKVMYLYFMVSSKFACPDVCINCNYKVCVIECLIVLFVFVVFTRWHED
ncbi:hypothetical protein KDRO_E05350 [Kluyveromyces lactis]|nr:hypothetical protein KDRO_E05350 [Kluyveromyces lactis]